MAEVCFHAGGSVQVSVSPLQRKMTISTSKIISERNHKYPSGTTPALPVLIRALGDDQDAVSYAMGKVPILQNIYVSSDDVTGCSTNMAEVGKKKVD